MGNNITIATWLDKNNSNDYIKRLNEYLISNASGFVTTTMWCLEVLPK